MSLAAWIPRFVLASSDLVQHNAMVENTIAPGGIGLQGEFFNLLLDSYFHLLFEQFIYVITMVSEWTLPPGKGKKVCVSGSGGFIGSHIAKHLKQVGYFVIACDWKKNEFMEDSE